MPKDIGYYPKGPINQHKALAAGDDARMAKDDTANKGGGFDKSEGVPGKIHKSGTSTGSGGGGKSGHYADPHGG